MPVGKGSLKRATTATKEKKTAEVVKQEIVALTENGVVEIDPKTVEFRTTRKNEKMIESVKKYGVILPVVVVKTDNGLKVVDGARRLTALTKLGIEKVKAVVLEGNGDQIRKELVKFSPKFNCDECDAVAPAKKADDIHEKKFNAIKRLGESEMPTYLL
mgnify:FL=1